MLFPHHQLQHGHDADQPAEERKPPHGDQRQDLGHFFVKIVFDHHGQAEFGVVENGNHEGDQQPAADRRADNSYL